MKDLTTPQTRRYTTVWNMDRVAVDMDIHGYIRGYIHGYIHVWISDFGNIHGYLWILMDIFM